MALYRCRWQVEIAIKRWKSVLDVDALRAKATSPLAEVWLHGKLLYALMLERRMRRQLGDSWGRLDHERVGTWWRVWGMLKPTFKGPGGTTRFLLGRRAELCPETVFRYDAAQEAMPGGASWPLQYSRFIRWHIYR
jgi:hypothetical protein